VVESQWWMTGASETPSFKPVPAIGRILFFLPILSRGLRSTAGVGGCGFAGPVLEPLAGALIPFAFPGGEKSGYEPDAAVVGVTPQTDTR
jgi:hypothetical protein